MTKNKTRICTVAMAAALLTVGVAGTAFATGGAFDGLDDAVCRLDCLDDEAPRDDSNGTNADAQAEGDEGGVSASVDVEVRSEDGAEAGAQSAEDCLCDTVNGLKGDLESETDRLKADLTATIEETQNEATATAESTESEDCLCGALDDVERKAAHVRADAETTIEDTKNEATATAESTESEDCLCDTVNGLKGETDRLTADVNANLDTVKGDVEGKQGEVTAELEGVQHSASEETSFVTDCVDFLNQDVTEIGIFAWLKF